MLIVFNEGAYAGAIFTFSLEGLLCDAKDMVVTCYLMIM